MDNLIASFFLTVTMALKEPRVLGEKSQVDALKKQTKVLASVAMDLEKRYPDPWVSAIFKFNILKNLEKMGTAFVLQPGEVFAYHDNILPEFNGKVVKNSNSHFSWDEGYQSDGFLVADGVCHLASLLRWAAVEAGLKVMAPTSHDFREIPGIAKSYGTSIYYLPDQAMASKMQNLYIENSFREPISFYFEINGNDLILKISK